MRAEYVVYFWDPTSLHTCKMRELLGWLATVSCCFLSPLPSFAFLVPLPPLQQSIHPLLQSSSLWWVSCHCLSLQLWTQLPEPDGLISTSPSRSHGAYKEPSEPEATADWPWSVEISLRQNNVAGEGGRRKKINKLINKYNVYSATLNAAWSRLRTLCSSFRECQYFSSTWLRFDSQ